MNNTFRINLSPFLRGTALKRGAVFGAILIGALAAFEIFNYATTSFALSDVLGNLSTAGVRWSTVLALAFCGIDFAGIARLFTPQRGQDEPAEVWYLFAAWILAAAFNAALTWWGVSVAIMSHTPQGSLIIGQAAMTKTIPILVAVMVWLIRVLIIGTFSMAGDNLFSMGEARRSLTSSLRGQPSTSARPALRPVQSMRPTAPEPTYQPVGMSARSQHEGASLRQ